MSINTRVERRRSQRASFPFEMWYKNHNKDVQGFKHAYGKNLSEHGLFFETYETFPTCTILEIKLELNADNTGKTSYSLLAEVVRTEEKKKQWLYGIGISFCKIDDNCRQLIKKYVSDKKELAEDIHLKDHTAVCPI